MSLLFQNSQRPEVLITRDNYLSLLAADPKNLFTTGIARPIPDEIDFVPGALDPLRKTHARARVQPS